LSHAERHMGSDRLSQDGEDRPFDLPDGVRPGERAVEAEVRHWKGRTMTRRLFVVTVACAVALPSIGATAKTAQQPRDRGAAPPPGGPAQLDPRLFARLKGRNIGPAVTGGRTVDFAVASDNVDVIYAATATGGVWKTSNRGATWDPVFEREG